MAVFYLHHAALGKTKYDRHGAVAHAGYILRKKAVGFVGARHMPDSYKQVLGWAARVYDESPRKNARVYDKLVLSLPRELSQNEHIHLLRTYLNMVTQGRTPYLFAIHTDKPDNPHAHVIIRDVDVQTGKRVAELSAAGSTYKLRALWERCTNGALRVHRVAISRYGKDSPQQRYYNAEIGRMARLAARTGLSAPTRPQMHPAESAGSSKVGAPPATDTTMLHLSGKTVVHDLLRATWELEQIQLAQDMVAEARRAQHEAAQKLRQYEDALPKAQEALTAARKNHLSAQGELRPYKRLTGRLKGWAFSLFGFEYKSPVRKRAEAAKGVYELADTKLTMVENRKTDMLRQMKVLETLKDNAVKSEEAMNNLLASFGSEEDIRIAKALHKEAIANLTTQLSPERLNDLMASNLITPEERIKALAIVQGQGKGVSY